MKTKSKKIEAVETRTIDVQVGDVFSAHGTDQLVIEIGIEKVRVWNEETRRVSAVDPRTLQKERGRRHENYANAVIRDFVKCRPALALKCGLAKEA